MSAHTWWASLRHGGLLIAPGRLAKFFPESLPPLESRIAERLRADLTRLDRPDAAADAKRDFLDTVLQAVCGIGSSGASWLKGGDVARTWSRRAVTGEAVRPRRVWEGPNGAVLPVFVEDEPRLDVGRGRRACSRVVEWLRAGEEKLALITNHREFRLIYAGLDYDAWVHWDTALWFEEGRPGPQVDALRALLGPEALIGKPGERSALLQAIDESRRGQSELSSELGERVRLAVERLIQEHAAPLSALGDTCPKRDIYIAATRIVMRMVVVFFAEARGLLPREDPRYHNSYGLQRLREELDRLAGGLQNAPRLRNRSGAWPRILALFRLLYSGSPHPQLPIPRYGGGLFAPGSTSAENAIDRTLAVFENPEHAPSDAVVRDLLQKLSITDMRVKVGNATRRVTAPVDFADLSSEYIGILYEGLLDYELRRAPDNDAIVFLTIGDQPALPLSRLERMDDASLKALVEKFKVKKAQATSEGDGDTEDEDADEEGDDSGASGDDVVDESPGDEADGGAEPLPALEDEATRDQTLEYTEAALAWAAKAVVAGGIVSKLKSKKADAVARHQQAVASAARALISRVVTPGEWYLVLWGGTRKGSGTFYTRPQLAVPTVRRTLRPLAYELKEPGEGNPELLPASVWAPRAPEAILSLKVCDPAVGSGSFPVAALRYLTDTLWQSLVHHGWLVEDGGRLKVTEAADRPAWFVESVRNLPVDADDPEAYIRPRLRRVVVERSLYGVDYDALAIELARLSLWVETMDRDLPFEFLDHRFKVGNSLVGCWFDQLDVYPFEAWEREGGDKAHTQFVHHFRQKAARGGKGGAQAGDKWTQAIKDFKGSATFKAAANAYLTRQATFDLLIEGRTPSTLHDEVASLFAELAALPVHEPERRAEFYDQRIQKHPGYAGLKDQFDLWCATWFWPPDALSQAPLPGAVAPPSGETAQILHALRREHRFFHWELEFPDVFATQGGGFDALIGNPPWEIQKPNSREFFSDIDPLYRSYGKQEAVTQQKGYFTADQGVETDWIRYSYRYKALSNWNKNVAKPSGELPLPGRRVRGYADPNHPFRHQGSADINTYKMFLEQSHALLRAGGRLGMIIPSGVYTDKGSTDLRTLFIESCQWRWLFVFENREKIFDIHRSFKFGPLVLEKEGTTAEVLTAFMRHDLADWEQAEKLVIGYGRQQVSRFSPRTRAVLEIRDKRDLEVLEKIYANSVLLGDEGPEGWGIKYATEFHMTNDSKLFAPRPEWEAKGYQADEYGRWIKFREKRPVEEHPKEVGWIQLADGSGVVHEDAIEDIALPLYEGRMIGQFDFSEKGWVSGKGRSAVWRDIPWTSKVFEPQFLMNARTRDETHGAVSGTKLSASELWARVGFMDVTSATNRRTIVASAVGGFPCGNKVPTLTVERNGTVRGLALLAILNSFVFDYQLRTRLGGLTVNYFILADAALPRVGGVEATAQVASLALAHPQFAPLLYGDEAMSAMPALTAHERLRLRCSLDAIVAAAYGLHLDELAWILRDCDWPTNDISGRGLDPKGFWRVDRELAPELRHTVLTLVAFSDLLSCCSGSDRAGGVDRFLSQNNGAGWLVPETLRLSDFGLGHDDRSKQAQPVRQLLGPRCFDWQRDISPAAKSAEYERHARNLLGAESFRSLRAERQGQARNVRYDEPNASAPLPMAAEGKLPFGEET
jgi:hypothetical protein